jgi:hypothetical protein
MGLIDTAFIPGGVSNSLMRGVYYGQSYGWVRLQQRSYGMGFYFIYLIDGQSFESGCPTDDAK